MAFLISRRRTELAIGLTLRGLFIYPILAISCKYKLHQLRQRPARLAQRFDRGQSLPSQILSPAPTLGHAKQARVGQLASSRILADVLAGVLGRPLHVDEVVSDLETRPKQRPKVCNRSNSS